MRTGGDYDGAGERWWPRPGGAEGLETRVWGPGSGVAGLGDGG